MRRSTLRLYGPFLAIALVQALFIVAAPSRAPGKQQLATGQGAFQGGTGGAATGATGSNAAGGATGSGATLGGAGATGAGGGAGGAAGGGAAGSGGGAGGGAAGVAGGGGGDGSAVAAGDTSHCAGGYQFDILIAHGPPCQPKFSGPNGGATYQGVSDTTIKVIYFESAPNEQVNTILGAKGLATTKDQVDAALEAFTTFVNSHYELWGRHIEVEHVVGDCPTTPPDYDKCLAAAQEVVKKQPFAVIWWTSLYADVFDVWANAGIVTIGGNAFDTSYYNDRRPYRYDVAMDGTQSADMIAEYYCTKLVGGHPDHAGSVIHATIGPRDSVSRKLGIVVPEIRANTLTAQRVIDKVRACGGPDAAVDHPFTYKSDINSATTQTEATVAALAQLKVTTVVCMCDPIAPVFLTQGLSSQRYFPEHVLPGLGLLDYDLLGQLYDPQQWQHVFGPSQLPIPVTLDDSDAARVWRTVGNSGHPCGNNGCGYPWAYFSFLGSALQQTGPALDPLTFEQGVLGNLPATGGSGFAQLMRYGPGDYTGVSDEKEVYWDPSKTTPTDGSAGAYVPVNGDRRYQLGEWNQSGDLSGIPVRP
ncbi:MAG: hypothetical protein QOJ67_3403 [Acidimicrobiaceae bacterium]|jgi:hypothetical protein